MPMHAYGRRRGRRMRGGALKGWLAKAHKFIKENKLLSRAGAALGGLHPGFARAGQVAGLFGYGRRRPMRHHGGALGLAGAARRRGHRGRFIR